MLFFQDTAIDIYFENIAIIIGGSFIALLLFMIIHRIFIAQSKKLIEKAKRQTALTKGIHISLKGLCVIFSIVFAVSAASLALVYLRYDEAKYKGMVKNRETNAYGLTLNEIKYYNRHSLKETKINPEDFDSLRGKIVIVYRYDCIACHELYAELSSLEDAVYISSRTKTGLAFREYFEPSLHVVPSGIYIRADGIPVTLGLYAKDEETQAFIFDYDNYNRLLNVRELDLQ